MPKSPRKRGVGQKRKSPGSTAKAKSARTTRPRSKQRAAVTPPAAIQPPSATEEALFMETLIDNGQAAPPGEDSKLPGATHSIVKDDAGNLKVVRRRFSVA